MKVDTITRAYKEYDATLKNVQWSISAWNTKGELVVSLWEHSRVKGSPLGTVQFRNGRPVSYISNGQKEFLKNIEKAYNTGSTLRLVLVRAEDPDSIEKGESGSGKIEFISVRPTWIGKVLKFNPTEFVIEFRAK